MLNKITLFLLGLFFSFNAQAICLFNCDYSKGVKIIHAEIQPIGGIITCLNKDVKWDKDNYYKDPPKVKMKFNVILSDDRVIEQKDILGELGSFSGLRWMEIQDKRMPCYTWQFKDYATSFLEHNGSYRRWDKESELQDKEYAELIDGIKYLFIQVDNYKTNKPISSFEFKIDKK